MRLLAAESVMRKLYRRNSQLEAEHKQRPSTSGGVHLDGRPAADSARPQTAAGVPTQSAPGEDESTVLSEANEHALYLLRQKESDLQRMKEYTAGLHAQLTEATALGAKHPNGDAATTGSGQPRGGGEWEGGGCWCGR